MTLGGHTDLAPDGWVARLPTPWRHYARLMRLDRPIGTWLLLLPCWQGAALAGGLPDSLWVWPLFALGAVLMRGAGCVLNDLMDRDLDAEVERTRSRPLASGATPPHHAVLLMLALTLGGGLILLALDPLAQQVAVASLLVVAVYPLMKRITWWPQVVLGIAFNVGVLVGYAAVAGALSAGAALLYLAGICWTLGYDTIYAHQDKADDARIGVKSTARRLGAASRGWILGFYLAQLALTAAALALTGGVWWLAPLGLAALHLAAQVGWVEFDRPASCLYWFRANVWPGWAIVAACALAGAEI